MRFVQIKSVEQQGQLMQHRTRDVLIRQRTLIINALRAHLAELGIRATRGSTNCKRSWPTIAMNRRSRGASATRRISRNARMVQSPVDPAALRTKLRSLAPPGVCTTSGWNINP